jgi:hypothetical protein
MFHSIRRRQACELRDDATVVWRGELRPPGRFGVLGSGGICEHVSGSSQFLPHRFQGIVWRQVGASQLSSNTELQHRRIETVPEGMPKALEGFFWGGMVAGTWKATEKEQLGIEGAGSGSGGQDQIGAGIGQCEGLRAGLADHHHRAGPTNSRGSNEVHGVFDARVEHHQTRIVDRVMEHGLWLDHPKR